MAELIVVTAAWWLVLAVGAVLVLSLLPGDPEPLWFVILAGLLLWWAFRWAVPTVAWIERRFWETSPSDLEQRAVRRLLGTAIIFVCLMVEVWRPYVRWTLDGLAEARASGINIEPSELIVMLPIILLIVAWYLADPVVARLERHWSRRAG